MPQHSSLEQSFTSFLRNASRIHCPIDDCGEAFPDLEGRIKAHLETHHPDLLARKDFPTLLHQIRKETSVTSQRRPYGKQSAQPGSSEAVPSVIAEAGQADVSPGGDTPGPPSSKRLKSPNARPKSSSPPRRSRVRQDPDFRRSPHAGKLWSPDDAPPQSPTQKPSRQRTQPRHQITPAESDVSYADSETTKLIKQPETRPISQDQLVAEVKGIYAGLVMVESKCIEVDNAQSSQNDAKLNNEQWQALTALHRTLLHEHHDFFLASQHPSASPALRRLASKYAMPARMWRHGIHSFLELLRHRLPASLEHMLTFIYLAYSMMALLYETVPAFEDTWIECLGDLGRYRMAIEDDDIRDREVWTAVSRHWYSKASDKAPTTGRLYHHLAILARPNALQQLFYYAKSLCVPIPFASARESIMTLFDPILKAPSTQNSRLIPIDAAFVKANGIMFSGNYLDQFTSAMEEFLSKLDGHINRTNRRWMESGYYIAISICCALLSYGKEDNEIQNAIKPQNADEATEMDTTDTSEGKPERSFSSAARLAQGTYMVVFRRIGDTNILPFVHVTMVFIFHLTHFPNAISLVEGDIPWELVSVLLNSLLQSYRSYDRIRSDQFPRQEKVPAPRPLPEDFAMKGLLWVEDYFPNDWFSNEKIDDDEKYFEMKSMTEERKERILWLGCRVAKQGKWLIYDETLHQFQAAAQYQGMVADDNDAMSTLDPEDEEFSGASTVGSGWTSVKAERGDEEDTMDLDNDPIAGSGAYYIQQ
ncbi:hypothetical protein DL764_002654 [Monosporascus ibericus]|uniref:DNA/RNA-binding domain-containing protein n=1 Tax=Monosporascus ibericus TaxID=155417 RepID=A0A4Q4TKS5_9PEZI|nr:hypothetical protein DL764_002654 [Monosporascus ibericus]